VRPRLTYAAALLALVFAGGTLGYHLIEGAGWWPSFYMTVITLTTVGYGEVFPLSPAGEVFTVALLLTGLGLILLVATEMARSVLAGELRQVLGQARRSRMIEKLSGHEIVCGWGRMGQAVAEELRRGARPFAVIERNPDKVRRLQELGVNVVAGDATSEAVLRSAGVARARGLVACLNDDAHNVYTVLTARALNPALFIVARATEEGAEARILQAGANRAVNPYHLGGLRLAHLLLKPAVVDFLDVSLGPAGKTLQLEQVALPAASQAAGRTLAELDLRRRLGVAVAAVRRGDTLFPNPEATLRLEAGDVLVVLGTPPQLESFESVVTAQGASQEG
jgi:voltage-gated potassium channel